MVEYSLQLDAVFTSLADPTRRDMLRRISLQELSIGALAQPYNLTFAAISKHIKVLEAAHLVTKRRHGKEQLVRLAPDTLKQVDEYLDFYRQFWESRLDSLADYLKDVQK